MPPVLSGETRVLAGRVVRLIDHPSLVLTAATLIDGTGRPPVTDGAVVIKDRRVVYAGSAAGAPVVADAERRDFPGMTLLPGLIDAHVHLTGDVTSDVYRRFLTPHPQVRIIRAARDAGQQLACGFTTVRDIGLPGPGLALKEAIAAGVIDGPRILTAVAAISQTGGHADWHTFPLSWVNQSAFPRGLMVDGPDACRKAVRLLGRAGADLIKLYLESGGVTNTAEDLHAVAEFADDELRALVEEAHRRHLRVAAHAKSAWVIRRAVSFGVDTIEHGDLEPTDTDVFDLMAEKGTILVPTLSLYYWVSTEGERWGVFKEGRDAATWHLPRRQEMVRIARQHGVKIATGTDTGSKMGMGRNAMELRLLVEAGLTPMEAIVSATQVAAQALDRQAELGTLETGKLADVLVVNGDPSRDIGVLLADGNPVSVFSSACDSINGASPH